MTIFINKQLEKNSGVSIAYLDSTKKPESFLMLNEAFFTNFIGANHLEYKSNSTFSDYLFYLSDNKDVVMDPLLGESVFVNYNWLGGETLTNTTTKFTYTVRTNNTKIEKETINFVTYEVVKDPEIIKEKSGVETKYDIVEIGGRWE